MTTQQVKTYTTNEIAALTGYTASRLSQLREESVPGEEGKDFFFKRGTYYFTDEALTRILIHKKEAPARRGKGGGRPRKNISS